MVIGNKVDVQKDRAVSKEEGKALAEDFGAGFLEVSVSLVFHLLIEYYLSECFLLDVHAG